MTLSQSKFAPTIVLTISIAALIIPLIFMLERVLRYTHGIFSYPLDDSYIHLAVAKNLTLNNVWGISPHEFASASSSVLYPLLLSAIFKLTGVQTIVPFIVNLVTAIVFLVVVQKWLTRQGIGLTGQLIVLLLGIFLIPLPAIVMVGMEHTLHLLFFFLFLTSFAQALEDMINAPDKKIPLPWTVYLYGALMMAARFESMSILALACCILLFQRRWITAVKLGFICFLPVLIFGIYSISKGGFFLPNSVMLKSSMPLLNLEDMLAYIKEEYLPRFFTADETYNTLGLQRLLLLLPLTYLIFRKATKDKISYRYLLLMLMASCVFHIAFMTFSFYARYEAYLVGSSVIICATLFVKYAKVNVNESFSTPEWIAALFAIILVAPLVTRSWDVFNRVPLGAIWTFDQQYQMGHFVHEYYDRDGVAFNDIGAVSYFSAGRKLDVLGLGNNDIAHRRHNHQNSPAYLDSLSKSRDIKIAILYEPRFHSVARNWQKVASWDIPYRDEVSFYDSVTFYAVNPIDAPQLTANLKKYQPSLPQDIIVRYY